MEPGQSETVGAIAAALVKAQTVMKAAIKDSKNPFFKSNYADLASVWEACRVPLTSNGIAVSQRVFHSPGGIGVSTTLLHVSGEWISDALVLPMGEKTTPQSAGSAITYARRYGLAAIVGVSTEDDDGNLATGNRQPVAKLPQQGVDLLDLL